MNFFINKNQKGFSAAALIIVIGILVFAGAFGIRYLIQKSPYETANWKTYKNNDLGIEFKYPNDMDITFEKSYETAPELSVSIARDPDYFIDFSVTRGPFPGLTKSGEHILCLIEGAFGCATYTPVRQLTINGKLAKVWDYAGEGGRVRLVEILHQNRLYQFGQFLVQKDSIVEDIAKTLIISQSNLEKTITDWSEYKNVSSQSSLFDSGLSCQSSNLTKEYSDYSAQVRKYDSAKKLTILKSPSGTFYIDLITTPNYFKWDQAKVNSLNNNCFLEPYVLVPRYIYADRLISILAVCAAGDAPEDPLLASKQKAESQQCQSMLDRIDVILK